MRQSFALMFALCALLLAACNANDLPIAPSPTPVPLASAFALATPATPAISQLQVATQTPAPQLTGLAPAVPSPQQATPVPGHAAPPASTAQAGEAAGEIKQIEDNAAQIRGLKPKKDVPEVFLTKEQMRNNLVKEVDSGYSRQEAHRDAFELWLLRLVKDRSIDLYQTEIDLENEQVIGYYDQKEHDLFVLGNQGKLDPQARETVAHEFVHSLQDQYYDLGKMLPEHSHDGDRSQAVRSLVEGDATLSGLMYAYRYMSGTDFQQLMQGSGQNSTQVLDKVPRYIRDDLLFPYDKGSAFVSRLIEINGFQAVNAALADPPTSTEQIMHPEKYTQTPRDVPLPVALTPLTSTLGTGWTYQDGGTTGEFDLRVLLEENGVSNAEDAAAGWGGGRYAFYQNGDAGLIIETTRWDTSKDADEFDTAMHQTLEKAQQNGDLWSDGSRFFALKRSGDIITYIASTDRTAIENALAAK